MSWRTQGHYVGLGDAERDWLRDFDRQWDTKAEGRSRSDALSDVFVPREGLREEASPNPSLNRFEIEAKLLVLASRVRCFTVPKYARCGWYISVTQKSGKYSRVYFPDEESAAQAYHALEELLLWFPRT